MKKTFLEYLAESAEGPRIPHPEDSIFDGSAEAKKYLGALKEVAANPTEISIKWDGGIALFFGRMQDGRFFITDKYMPAKGVYPTSPNQWIEYDQSRGANREDLYGKINGIWKGLEQSVGSTIGTFKGDLMHYGVLQPVDGNFIFRPTTVEYRFPVDSQLGKIMQGKVGVIVVHQFNGKPWDGKSGLANVGNVAILGPKAGLAFSISLPSSLTIESDRLISSAGPAIDDFLAGLSTTAKNAIKTYFNKRITKQTNQDIKQWLGQNISRKQYDFLVGTDDTRGYLVEKKPAFDQLIHVWNSLYKLKTNLVGQLEKQVKGFQQYVHGQPGGEGFVFPSSIGLIKLVDREIFGSAHFAKND